ncbi:MAG TPA: twin-arginine translocase TatA/TatE family subunit [Candidatus Dormibacteraeota bacterium]|nr:twin-arginine translocase TatA/TatE family subunit [Candidatus Dormibacteraeota bacterium]
MFGIHPVYFIVLLVIVLIIFGPGRLPELGGAVGKAMREFRKATNELTTEVTNATQSKPEPTAASATSAPESAAKGSTSEADSSKN